MNPQQPNYGQGPPPPQGQVPPQGYGYYPNPAPGQPPQQQPYGYYQPPPGSAPGYPPQPGQYPPGPPGPYGAPGQQPYPPPAHGYGAPQWQQPPPVQQQAVPPYGGYAASVPPTPASLGYDPAQKNHVQRVDTSSDVEGLRKAMKGMGCDEKALIRILTQTKYSNPWAMAQLVEDYNKRFIRDLAKDLESETRGDFETALLELIRSPLENDVRNLSQALNRAGTDEDALNDVLLCRSNADIRAITAEYKRIKGRDLLEDIKDDVDVALSRFYSMILAANRAEDAAPILPADIDHKVTGLQRDTEGTIGGANTVAVSQIFTSCNDAQIRALREAFQQKYHAVLDDVIKKEFSGDMEDALLRILQHSTDRAQSDAARLRAPLRKTIRKDKLFISRVIALYWDRPRLEAAKEAYKKANGKPLYKDIKDALSGDYEDLMVALVGKE